MLASSFNQLIKQIEFGFYAMTELKPTIISAVAVVQRFINLSTNATLNQKIASIIRL